MVFLKKNKFKKVTAIILFYSMVFGTSANCGQNNISIPANLGRIARSFNAKGADKLVIHIQDIHCNSTVQKNIERILKLLITCKNIRAVGIEGAGGPVDTSVFGVFPDNQVKNTVCEKFINKGVLTGAEKLSICNYNDLDFKIFGVEETSLYIDNLISFRSVYEKYKNNGTYFDKIEHFLSNLKKDVYPPALNDLDLNYMKYFTDKISPDELMSYLINQAREYALPLNKYPNINKFFEIKNSEDSHLNYEELASDLKSLMEKLKSRISPQEYRILTQAELEYQIGKLSTAEYSKKIARYISAGDYPNIDKFLVMNKLREEINQVQLNREIDMLEADLRDFIGRKIYGRLYSTRKKELDKFHEITLYLAITKLLVLLQLTDTQYKFYLNLKTKTNFERMISILDEQKNQRKITGFEDLFYPGTMNSASDLILTAEKFYDQANRRTAFLVDNLVERMQRENDNSAILLTGGYHTDQIEKLLKDKNISFITITPSASILESKNYMKLMTGNILDSPPYAKAEYIAFPVLCDESLANSDFFAGLRHQFALNLITNKTVSITEYRKMLKDDTAKQMFNKLLALAGFVAQESTKTTVDDVIVKFTPDYITDIISKYTDSKIVDELESMGFDVTTIENNQCENYLSYLIYFLRLSLKLTDSEKDESYYLNKIFNSTKKLNKMFIHNIISREILISRIRQTAFDILKTMESDNLLRLNPLFKPADITIDADFNITSNQELEISRYDHFQMTFKDITGKEVSFFAKSAFPTDMEGIALQGLKALGRQSYNYDFVNLPHGHFSGFHITEVIGDIYGSEFDFGSPYAADFARLYGCSVAEAFVLKIPNRILNNTRVSLKDAKPVAFYNIELQHAFTDYDTDKIINSLIHLINMISDEGMDENETRGLVVAFLRGFHETSIDIHQHFYKNYNSIKNYPPLAVNEYWKSHLNEISLLIENSTHTLNTIISGINEEFPFEIMPNEIISTSAYYHNILKERETLIRQMAYKIAREMAQNGLIALPIDLFLDDIRIGNNFKIPVNPNGKLVGPVAFEMTIPLLNGIRKTFFVKSAEKENIEETGYLVLEAFNRKKNLYFFSKHKHSIYEGFNVSESIGDEDLDNFDFKSPNLRLLPELIGRTVGEAYLLGLTDRHESNIRILYKDGIPVEAFNIDLETIMFEYSFGEAVFVLESLIFRLQEKGIDDKEITDFCVYYIKGIKKSVAQMLSYYNAHKKELREFPGLAGKSEWINLLDNMQSNADKTDRHIEDLLRYINHNYGLNLSKEYIDFYPDDKSAYGYSNHFSSVSRKLIAHINSNMQDEITSLRKSIKDYPVVLMLDLLNQAVNGLENTDSRAESLIKNIDVEKLIDFISGFSDSNIETQILKIGSTRKNISETEFKIFADYLVSLLDISLNKSDTADKIRHLAIALQKTSGPDKKTVNSVLFDRFKVALFSKTDAITKKYNAIYNSPIQIVRLEMFFDRAIRFVSPFVIRFYKAMPTLLYLPVAFLTKVVNYIELSRKQRIDLIKNSAKQDYTNLISEIQSISSQWNINLDSIISELKVIMELFSKFNGEIGYVRKTNEGVLKSLDYRFLKEHGYLDLIGRGFDSKIGFSLFTDFKDGTANIRSASAILDNLDSIPQEILEGFPSWNNTFLVAREDSRVHGYAYKLELYINSLYDNAKEMPGTIYHEYLGHILVNGLVDNAFKTGDFAELEKRFPSGDVLDILYNSANLKTFSRDQIKFAITTSIGKDDIKTIPAETIKSIIDEYNKHRVTQYKVSFKTSKSLLGQTIEIKNIGFDFIQWTQENNPAMFWLLVKYNMYFDDSGIDKKYDEEMGLGIAHNAYICEIIALAVGDNFSSTQNAFMDFNKSEIKKIVSRNLLKGWLWDSLSGWYKPESEPDKSSRSKQIKVTFNKESAKNITVKVKQGGKEELQYFVKQHQPEPFSRKSEGWTKIYTDKNSKVFLKITRYPIFALKRFLYNIQGVPRLRKISGRLYNFINNRYPSSEFIAANKLGNLVPAMHIFAGQESYIQKKMNFTIEELLKKYAEENNIRSINLIIDRWFDTQVKMWQQGVFDEDFSMFPQNYGLDDPENPLVLCVDLGLLRNNINNIGSYITGETKDIYPTMIRYLRQIIPEQCVAHFEDKFSIIFTPDKISSVWNKNAPVAANDINLETLETLFERNKSPEPSLKADIDFYIEEFINEIGLENEINYLLPMIKNIYDKCFITDSDVKFIEGKDLSEKESGLLFADILSGKTDFHISLKKLLLQIISTGNDNKAELFIVSVYKTITDHLRNVPSNKHDGMPSKFNNYYRLVEESI